jgi:ATP synthase protein I
LAGSFAGMSHALAPRFSTCGRTGKDGMTEDELGQDPKSPQDARLASLDERLRKAQVGEAERTGTAGPGLKTYRDQVEGTRVLTVLVSYPLGSALVGYAIDRMAGTHGIWVAMLFVGFGLAMWQVWKSSQASGTDRPRED